MMRTSGPFTIFLACKFPVSRLANLCRRLGEAIELQFLAGDTPKCTETINKVKNQILSSDGVLFLLDGEVSDWLVAEYGIARSQNKVIGIITADKEPPSGPFSADREYVSVADLNEEELSVRLVQYLYSLKEEVKSAHTPPDIIEPAFIRDFLKHRVKLYKDGRLEYETYVQIECKRDGLSDIRHSIHMNYSLCWPQTDVSEPSVHSIPLDNDHTFTMERVSSDPDKYTWKFNVEPPLRAEDTVAYGWRCEFRHYLPVSKAELQPLVAATRYPFPEDRVEHHYYINTPTKLLEMKLDFEDASRIGVCEVMACVGRTFSTRTNDRKEVDRIKDRLFVNDFLGRREVTFLVDNPRLNYTYAILWSLNC